MLKIAESKLTNQYNYKLIKTINQFSAPVTVYAKRHPDMKMSVIYYDAETQMVLRQQIYSEEEINIILDSIDILDKIQKKTGIISKLIKRN